MRTRSKSQWNTCRGSSATIVCRHSPGRIPLSSISVSSGVRASCTARATRPATKGQEGLRSIQRGVQCKSIRLAWRLKPSRFQLCLRTGPRQRTLAAMFGALGAPTSVKRPAEAAAASPADEDSSDIRKLN
eukprot:5556191-Pyramimonas_sp.AAC.1